MSIDGRCDYCGTWAGEMRCDACGAPKRPVARPVSPFDAFFDDVFTGRPGEVLRYRVHRQQAMAERVAGHCEALAKTVGSWP